MVWDVCPTSPGCVPAPGTAGLFTEQSEVTYVGFDGVCYSNGATVPCNFAPPCDRQGTFCGPLTAVANLTESGAPGMLEDVVIQISQDPDAGNVVTGCRNDDAGEFGLCLGTGKVDAPTSNLTSPIPGDPLGADPTFGCSYCYGNATRAVAAGLPGLQHGVRSGSSATLAGINTTIVALQLSSDLDTEAILTVRQARPALDAPPGEVELFDGLTAVDCAQGGVTQVVVHGGGFGPPGACLTGTPSSCPLSGPPGAGYRLEVLGPAGTYVPADNQVWSDGQVSGTLPVGMMNGPVRVVTPDAPLGLASSEVVSECIGVVGGLFFPGGAGSNATGGGFTAKIEIGREMTPTVATGTTSGGDPIQMRVGTAVRP